MEKHISCCRAIALLDKAGLKHETHLFLEGENAPASDVAAVIKRVYEEAKADLLIASRSNKVIHFATEGSGYAYRFAG